ncbi:threonine-phosphate decarboxylase [Rhodobacteraceae bacterium 2CG4]|uniref:threonine-phosphate decarboxylase n=1 Tax=Halovulum marinum TaxID=2662447 RepID=A0A6L5Z1N3_9RHOB|nr:threonine-phosphate decarboxylase CobD [Halovulum marinum]MSU90463.1 threonine-phosphate decarboxylase [Halovulum marinum]
MREHGGDLDAAAARYGGDPADWIDLSTGINRQPWPMPDLPEAVTRALPTRALTEAAMAAARSAYRTDAPGLALAGAQAAIQLVPLLRPRGLARVLSPTYNEHAGALDAAGWHVETPAAPEDLAGADVAVVVNPNNPDGRAHDPAALRALAAQVGLLVVDESFADPEPQLSLLPDLPPEGVLVLRSFGKFYGQAGLRLGFAFGAEADIARMRALAGPWAASGPALAAGAQALADSGWRSRAVDRLAAGAERLDALATGAGWRLAGGTTQFRLYDVGDGQAARARLARHRIWSRAFAARPEWLRLGLPGPEHEWRRLAEALR